MLLCISSESNQDSEPRLQNWI